MQTSDFPTTKYINLMRLIGQLVRVLEIQKISSQRNLLTKENFEKVVCDIKIGDPNFEGACLHMLNERVERANH